MIISDENFQKLLQRLAERRVSWTEIDTLAEFAQWLIEENKLQSKAMAALMDRRRDIVTDGLYIYRAADGGAAVMNRKLNYEPNTEEWMGGDIVIHDGDAKEPKMLMIVLGHSRDGQIRTKYISKGRKRRVMKNFLDCLHKPERFNIQSSWGKYTQEVLGRIQIDWDRVRIFNHRHSVGTLVRATGGGGFEACTTGPAYMDAGGSALVDLEGYLAWPLYFVKAVQEAEPSS